MLTFEDALVIAKAAARISPNAKNPAFELLHPRDSRGRFGKKLDLMGALARLSSDKPALPLAAAPTRNVLARPGPRQLPARDASSTVKPMTTRKPKEPKEFKLTRVLPNGTEKEWPGTFSSRRAALTAVSRSLVDNGAADKAEAQRFAADLDRRELGETVAHPSGYSFRLTGVGESSPAPAAPVAPEAEPGSRSLLDYKEVERFKELIEKLPSTSRDVPVMQRGKSPKVEARAALAAYRAGDRRTGDAHLANVVTASRANNQGLTHPDASRLVDLGEKAGLRSRRNLAASMARADRPSPEIMDAVGSAIEARRDKVTGLADVADVRDELEARGISRRDAARAFSAYFYDGGLHFRNDPTTADDDSRIDAGALEFAGVAGSERYNRVGNAKTGPGKPVSPAKVGEARRGSRAKKDEAAALDFMAQLDEPARGPVGVKPGDIAPGRTVTWREYRGDSTDHVERSGRVWASAPKVRGTKDTVWVIPDSKREGEASAVAVSLEARDHKMGGNDVLVSGRNERHTEAMSELLRTNPRASDAHKAAYFELYRARMDGDQEGVAAAQLKMDLTAAKQARVDAGDYRTDAEIARDYQAKAAPLRRRAYDASSAGKQRAKFGERYRDEEARTRRDAIAAGLSPIEGSGVPFDPSIHEPGPDIEPGGIPAGTLVDIDVPGWQASPELLEGRGEVMRHAVVAPRPTVADDSIARDALAEDAIRRASAGRSDERLRLEARRAAEATPEPHPVDERAELRRIQLAEIDATSAKRRDATQDRIDRAAIAIRRHAEARTMNANDPDDERWMTELRQAEQDLREYDVTIESDGTYRSGGRGGALIAYNQMGTEDMTVSALGAGTGLTAAEMIANAERMYGTDRRRWPARAQADLAKLERKARSAKVAPAPITAATDDQVLDAIRSMMDQPYDLVPLSLLRARFPDMSKEDFTALLKRMDRARIIRLDPDPNRKALPPEAHEAAVNLGGEDKHLVSIVG